MTTRLKFIGRRGDKSKSKSYTKKGPGRCHNYGRWGKSAHRIWSMYGGVYE